ncbi:MAG: hypothetical protein ACP5UZ_05490 [Thermoplasmata archaeon]
MGSKNSVMKITTAFVALEAVFMYYVIGLILVGYRPGFALSGFNIVDSHIVFTNPVKYFPVLGYTLKTFFLYYWNYYHYNPAVNPGGSLYNTFDLKPVEIFMFAVWLGLIVVAITTAIVYAVKLRGIRNAIQKAPQSTGNRELSVKKKSID